jgi:molybdenum cofactor cytidylyltransferase
MLVKVSAILLAAGLSQRMGRDKLLLEYRGKSILQHAVDLLSGLDVYERILVTTDVRAKTIDLAADVRLCINSNPEEGKSGSIKIGLEAAGGTHLLFLTADQPKLKVEDITPMLDAARKYPDMILHPVINSEPVSPTLFPARFREELLSLYKRSLKQQNDFGGQAIRDANKQSCLTIEPENPLRFADVDTAEDYRSLE